MRYGPNSHCHTHIHRCTNTYVDEVLSFCDAFFSQTFQEEMANHLPTMNSLMEIVERSESATLFIDEDMSSRITDLKIRRAYIVH